MNLTDPIRVLAGHAPDAAALVDERRTYSRAALDAAVGAAAADLARTGLVRGETVGAVAAAWRALDVVVALALARLGVAQIPLRRTEPGERIDALARGLGAVALIADGEARDDGLPLIRPSPEWLDGGRSMPPPADDVDDLPWIVAHSSGTTGPAKAIAVTHAMEAARTRRDALAFRHHVEERFLTLIGPGFYNSVSATVRCLSHGGAVVVAPRVDGYDALVAAIDRGGIGFLQLTPSHLHPLVEALPPGSRRLPGLRVLRVSSAALAPALLGRARERLSDRVHLTYGTNEAGTLAVATPDMLARMPSAVGRPLDGVAFEIVDGDGGPVMPGAVGEVRVRGPGVMDAYLGDAEATRRQCRGGWFLPGDLAQRTDDGMLILKGRSDRAMNIGGVLTAAEELEAIVLSHPAVIEAAAVPMPSERYQVVPAIAVVMRRPRAMADVLAHARRTLAGYPIALYRVGALPRTPIGKIDYAAVRRLVERRRDKE